jgi:hypothetical protein
MPALSDLVRPGRHLWRRVSNDNDQSTFSRRLGFTEQSFYYDSCFDGIFSLNWFLNRSTFG